MDEINTPNEPRPHRPGDPLADRRILEDAELDHTPVDDFKPLKTDPLLRTVAPAIQPDRRTRLRLARNLVLIVLLVILAFALIVVDAVEVIRRAEAVQPVLGWITGGIISVLLLFLVWTITTSIIGYARVRRSLLSHL